MTTPARRYPLIDALKTIAAQLIVLHHFAAYGPLSTAAQHAAPGLIAWLFEYGRMAVHVFLVVGGYLAARGLSSSAALWRSPWQQLAQRYLRLVGPYLAALALAVVGAMLARPWLQDGTVPAAPTSLQLLTHLLLLQNLLDVPALSAGVWYIAIDFQLFALLAVLLWLGRGPTRMAQGLTAMVAVASLWCFNRYAWLDDWAIYFAGAYGLGALAWWARRGGPASACTRGLFTATLVLAAGALAFDFRERAALALVTAVLLAAGGEGAPRLPRAVTDGLSRLGANSYALFLVHFPILLLVNAVFAVVQLQAPLAAWAFTLLGLVLCHLAAQGFHRWVESPLMRWLNPKPPVAAPAAVSATVPPAPLPLRARRFAPGGYRAVATALKRAAGTPAPAFTCRARVSAPGCPVWARSSFVRVGGGKLRPGPAG